MGLCGVQVAPLRLALVALVLVSGALYAEACNEAVCASLVSKCMLLKSCECNMLDKNNCTCCKDCHKCLATLYTECCSCVGMCPETSTKFNMYKKSTVEELDEPIPALFTVLTEDEDELFRWTTRTYPAHLDLLYFQPRGHSLDLELDLASSFAGNDGSTIRHGKHRISTQPHADTTNCTVAYMAQCMSLTKCRESCQSMGAARYRWFHDYGCCECIGSTCLDFGKGEPLCLHCPPGGDDDEEEGEGNGVGLAGKGGLDKEIRVDTLGRGGGAGRGTLPDSRVRGLTGRGGGGAGGLGGGSLESASLALGGLSGDYRDYHSKDKKKDKSTAHSAKPDKN